MTAQLLKIGLICFSALPLTATPLKTDILQSTQTYGVAKIDQSVGGGKLTIAGKTYDTGIGVHAVSELPLSVPEGKSSFRGMCGMDDTSEKGAKGKAQFRILSGSQVLWTSPIMKTGDSAQAFSVSFPHNTKKLYLQVDDLGNHAYDHANWVNLSWGQSGTNSKPATASVLHGKDFGLTPNGRNDQSAALRKALDAMRKASFSTLLLEKGTYHFWHTGALKKHIHISNHDQPTWQPVAIPLVDLHHATIDGKGSLFLFHGDVQPILIQDSENLTLKGISIDYEIPHHSQGVITKVDDTGYEMTVDQKQFPHRIDKGWFTFKGEGKERPDRSRSIVFDSKTREIVAGTSDFAHQGKLTTLSDGRYRVEKNIKKSGIKAGDIITMRHGSRRPHPAVVLYRAKNTSLLDVAIHSSDGMGLIAQRSENIYLKGGGVFPREGTGRYFSSGADATHFSNCKGKIITEGCLYEGMMDDAINVHATCLRIEEKKDNHTIRCRYVHGQAYGFETVMPGESIQFIQAKWLTPRDPSKVKSVQWIDQKNLIITLENPIPQDLGKGDAIENFDWHASVHFKNNIVRNNRARGSLFTTPKPIIVEGNTFETIAGSAILLAGDANGWYESGACHDVVIRKNIFKNNLTSRFQFTNAIISIYPEVHDLKGQKEYYHRNVRIEHNVFNTFNVPLVFAISTKGLVFSNNQITYNNDYPAWNKPPFILRRCMDVKVMDNEVKNTPHPWSKQKSFSLQLTPESAVEFNE